MADPALATIPDLTARGVDTSDSSRARAAIQDASNLIHQASARVWVEDGDLVDDVPGIVLTICCSVARRVLENPLQVASEQEGLADYNHGVTYSNTSNDVYLTRSEKAAIRVAAGRTGLGVIPTTRGTVETPSVIADDCLDLSFE